MSRTKKKTTIRHKTALTAETSTAHNAADNPSSSPLSDNDDVTADRGIGRGASTTEALDQNGLASNRLDPRDLRRFEMEVDDQDGHSTKMDGDPTRTPRSTPPRGIRYQQRHDEYLK